jgi:Domain of unknown function (DUF4390)
MTRPPPRAALLLAVLSLTVPPALAGPAAADAPPGPDAAAAPARSEQGRIDRVGVTREGRLVTVAAHLAGGFPPEIAEQIKSGVPKDLFYTITLNRRHHRWFDEELQSATVQFQIKYDTLSGRYRVLRRGPEGELRGEDLDDYAAAVDAVSHVDGVRLELPKDSPEYTHYVSAKAEMRAVELPLHLDYLFFFIPRLEYETPWARSGYLEDLPR